MAKKSTDYTNLLMYVVIIAVVVMFGLLIYKMKTEGINISIRLGSNAPSENEYNQPIDYNHESDDNFNLGLWYNSNFPSYISTVSNNCQLAGGTWQSTRTNVGCYDIPVWDYLTFCPSAEGTKLKLSCIGIRGIYTCAAHQVSCEI